MKLALCIGAIIVCVLGCMLLGWPIGVLLNKKGMKSDFASMPLLSSAIVGVIVGVFVCIIICNCIITVDPGYYAEAKLPDGTVKVLTSGSYNFVSPFAKVYKMETISKAHKFSESAENDDIYGAQTKEKDYLITVCNVNGRPDPERISEYVDTYGYVSFADDRISEILKSQTRRAFEIVVNPKTTEDVMSAKGEAAAEKIRADQQNEILRNQAENEKQIKQMETDAEAYATRERAKAEADAIRETGEAYKANTSLMDLKLKEIAADVDKAWAEKWSGFVFDTGAGFTFTDLSDTVKTLIGSGLDTLMPE